MSKQNFVFIVNVAYSMFNKNWICKETIFTWINAKFEINLKIQKFTKSFWNPSHVIGCHDIKWHKLVFSFDVHINYMQNAPNHNNCV
jgi:hypothetical protein